MTTPLEQLEPRLLWRHFQALTRIPRPSGHEREVRVYLRSVGDALGLETIEDAAGNVIIRKPATPGKEQCRGVIIQGHMDMVPQANGGIAHDFARDPIEAIVEGDWVRARGTTLGADNGIGVAAALAVLESDTIEHGQVEVLITSDEERGMTGALGLQSDVLKGSVFLNTDSEEEGELCIGCAGGANGNIVLTYEPESLDSTGITSVRLSITGLKGGHSGVDIDLGRGNANKLLFRLLKHLGMSGVSFRLAGVVGGNMRNAIPREAEAVLVVEREVLPALEEIVAEFSRKVRDELTIAEPDLSITLSDTELPISVIESGLQGRLINAVCACPNGVIRMSDSTEGLVETSNNLSTIRVADGRIEIKCLIRSSIDSAREAVCETIDATFSLIGAKTDFDGFYPGWKPDPESMILALAKTVYESRFGRLAKVGAIHAGLECGLLGARYPDWDMISFGPTINFPHSPDERVSIPSVERFWIFLTELLRKIP